MSEDTISRQAVIEINRSYHGQMPNEVNHRIWKEINELPSAQPIRCKACRWRDDYGHWLGCPVLNTDDDNFCSYAERRTDEA